MVGTCVEGRQTLENTQIQHNTVGKRITRGIEKIFPCRRGSDGEREVVKHNPLSGEWLPRERNDVQHLM